MTFAIISTTAVRRPLGGGDIGGGGSSDDAATAAAVVVVAFVFGYRRARILYAYLNYARKETGDQTSRPCHAISFP